MYIHIFVISLLHGVIIIPNVGLIKENESADLFSVKKSFTECLHVHVHQLTTTNCLITKSTNAITLRYL